MGRSRRGSKFSSMTGHQKRYFNESTLRRELQEEFKVLEILRGKVLAKRRAKHLIVALLVGGVVLLVLLLSLVTGLGEAVILGGVPLTTAALIVEYRLYSKRVSVPGQLYNEEYKRRVGRHLIRSLEVDLEFHPDKGLVEEVFLSAEFWSSQDYHSYWSEDCLKGKVGNTRMLMAEVHTTRTSDSSTVEIFCGWFVIADFHKHFCSGVVLEPDFAEAKLGRLGRALQKLGGNLELLENPEFEKAFVVRATDPVEVRYILTPDMQERILALRASRGRGVRLAFKGSELFIAIPNRIAGKDWFDPDPRKPASDLLQLRTIATDFVKQTTACFEIVEELNLNTRIWTKE